MDASNRTLRKTRLTLMGSSAISETRIMKDDDTEKARPISWKMAAPFRSRWKDQAGDSWYVPLAIGRSRPLAEFVEQTLQFGSDIHSFSMLDIAPLHQVNQFAILQHRNRRRRGRISC